MFRRVITSMAVIGVLAAIVAIQTSNGGPTTYGQPMNDVAPTVASVLITSDTADEVSAIDDNGVYGIDDDIEVTVTFSADIRVTGNPKIEIDVGGHARDALYQSHSGTAIIFSYTVAENDEDTDGVSIDANRLTTDGGTIESPSGTAATLTHTALSNQSSHKVDGVRPTIQSVSHSQGRRPRQNIYIAGDVVIVTVKFSEEVLVTGTPQIKLDLDGKEKIADFQTAYNSCAAEAVTPFTTCLQRIFRGNRRGQATSFYYTVAKGDQDTNGFAVPANAINLNQGSIKDAAGNTATLTHVTLADSPQGIIDGVAPTISSITITSDPGDDDTYHSGEAITLQVTFTGRLIMEGSVHSGHIPYLKLNVGDNARSANFTESNPEALNFAYVVRPTDEDTDGISIPANPIVLNDSKIYDRPNPNALGKNNPADLTHPGVPEAPGHKVSGASSAGTRGNNPQTQSLIIKGDPKVGQMLSVDTSGLTEHGDSSETAASTEASDHRDGRTTSIDVSLAATIAALDDGAKACASYLEPEPQDQRRAPADDSETMTIAWLSPDDDGYKVLQSSEEETYTITENDVGRSILAAVQYTDSEGQQQVLASVPTTVITKNTPATGSPAIGGTPQVGETLTVDTSSISDDDGLTSVSYSYQWIAGDTDIDGATGSSYLLTSSEQGKTIEVRVSFADDAENKETLTSAATVAIKPQSDNPQPAAPLWSANMLVVEYSDISIGAASADLFSNIGGTGNLQIRTLWSYRPDDDLRLAFQSAFDDAEDHQLIVGDLTLAFPEGSSGDASFKWTNVGIDWTDGQTIAVSIVPKTTTTEPTPNTAATGLPTISGTPQVGETLTADTSEIDDEEGLTNVSYSYRWVVNDGTTDTDILNATASIYTPSVSDVGQTITVKVSFTDDGDHAETLTSAATDAVLAAVPTGPLSLTVTRGGQIQELDVSWQAPASDGGSDVTGYKVQWKEAADSWDTAADVSEATVTGTTHTITSLTGGVEYSVRVIATNIAGDGPGSTEVRATPAGSTTARRGLVVIMMSSRDHHSITKGTKTQFQVSASNLPRDNDPATVDYILRGDVTETEGGANVDSCEDANLGTDIPISVVDSVSVQYGGTFGGPGCTAGNYTVTYVVTEADTDNRMAGIVFYYEVTEGLSEGSLGSSNNPATGAPTISGTAEVGETLTADTSGIADTDGLDNVSFSYQWLSSRDTVIPGATGSTYTLVSTDLGKIIKVKVTFTDDEGNEESLTSAATAAVAGGSNNPATGAPTISGTMQVGQTLTASTSGIADDDGLTNVSYTYQWIANYGTSDSDIQDATLSTYTLVSDDVDKTIKVKVSFTDDAENAETLTSSETDSVVAAPASNSPATGAPTITGTAQVGETLTASTTGISDTDGLTNVSYAYQWLTSRDAEIDGATSSTYTLVDADEGKTIQVRVTFTDDQDNAETLTSAATVEVAAAPPRSPHGQLPGRALLPRRGQFLHLRAALQ